MQLGLVARRPSIQQIRGPGEAPFSVARHYLTIEGWIPSSAATCICGGPLLTSRATASRLNSGVNSRLIFAIRHLPAQHKRIRGVRDTEGG